MMKKRHCRSAILFFLCLFFFVINSVSLFGQDEISKIAVRSVIAGGSVYMLDSENGDGGGNVAASVGPDGILLVDDMFKLVTPRLVLALKKINDSASVRIVINSHFHADHIEGNAVLSRSSIIIAHENVLKRLMEKGSWASANALPVVTFSERLNIRFNGEDIVLFHLPNGHTDNDVFVYFTGSKVIHMGDTYFNGMFPAVYTESGGNIRQLIINLEKVLADMPPDIKIIPGHGALATKKDFASYVTMLKETTALVDAAIKSGKTLEQSQQQNLLSKYNQLGEGGAQTTEQYLGMLYHLLSK